MPRLSRQSIMPLFIGVLFFSASLCADEFPFQPPQNFILNPKYIALHHPVQTDSVEAQLYFDQGLTFIYAFNHDAAYWSFLTASEADPKMAMAYWGMALSLGMTINTPITPERSRVAYVLVQKALLLASNSPAIEQAYAKALSARYAEDPDADQQMLNQYYSKGMKELSSLYPDDLDAATLYAESLLDLNPWHQWSSHGMPLDGTEEAVKMLQSVLRRDPDHLGANHYYIHAVEASAHPEIALISAERLKKRNLSLGHLLHMPAHIFMRVGDYHEAASSGEAAIAAVYAFMRDVGIDENHPEHALFHYYHVLVRSYTLEGRFKEAKRAADVLTKLYPVHYKRFPDLKACASATLSVLITFQRWDDLLELSAPPGELQLNGLLWRFGRTLAFIKLGELAKAREEYRHFLDGKSKLPSAILFGNNSADKIFGLADSFLQAQFAEAQGNSAQAVELLEKAIKEQDSLHYNEPSDWFFSIRETLGGLLLRMQKPVEAEAVFREDLRIHPRSGRALFGLRESLKIQSKTHDLYYVNEEFQKAWMYSDITLSVNSL